MANGSPTIGSIAQQLNLSTSTVSEVLRGKPGYNETTRQRVISTAKELGYRPNYLSRALVGSKSKTIGIWAAMTETAEVAQEAFAMLLQLLDDPAAQVENRKSHCELIIRDSTGPAAVRETTAVTSDTYGR